MPLILKPHTATRLVAADQTDGDGTVRGVTRSGVTTVAGHLVRLNALQSLEQFGLETDQGAKWLQDIGALTLAVGDHITVSGERYAIRTERTQHDGMAPVNYEVYFLEKVEA